VIHEAEVPLIRGAMERHLADSRVEALAFDYVHFYGNVNTFAWSPRWYRTEARILRNTIPAWGPEGLFFVVLETHKRGRYPRAAHCGAKIYHYGWLKTEEQQAIKKQNNSRFWAVPPGRVNYGAIDPQVLRGFTGTHPGVVRDWLPPAEGVWQADPGYRLTRRDRKHRWMMRAERWFGWQFNKKHYHLVA